MYEVKDVTLDGEPRKKFKCPGCGIWGFIDDEQYRGKVSIQCECGFHKTIDLSKEGEHVADEG